MAAKGGLGQDEALSGSNKELMEHLSGMVKSKENEVERQKIHITEVLSREQELKAKLARFE